MDSSEYQELIICLETGQRTGGQNALYDRNFVNWVSRNVPKKDEDLGVKILKNLLAITSKVRGSPNKTYIVATMFKVILLLLPSFYSHDRFMGTVLNKCVDLTWETYDCAGLSQSKQSGFRNMLEDFYRKILTYISEHGNKKSLNMMYSLDKSLSKELFDLRGKNKYIRPESKEYFKILGVYQNYLRKIISKFESHSEEIQ